MHGVTKTINLSALLRIEQVRPDSYRGHGQAGAPKRIFGGQIAAQSLRAAGETAGEGRVMNSMHSYFLRPGDPGLPVIYRVERLRDGVTYATRRVTATQRSKAIFTLTASFKRQEVTPDRQPRMGPVPLPESLPDPYAQQGIRSLADHQRATEIRFVPFTSQDVPGQKVWIKSATVLADDPLTHVCALAYCSDVTLASTAALPLRYPLSLHEEPHQLMLASLDHAMWIHRAFRADEWLLFVQKSPSSSDGRGLASGEFWTKDGQLVASVTQEALVRPFEHAA
ncbi:acyl-CoA thioesterase [Streptomyces nigra]|uniref:acyl-CoA thioesterase n=1 Tax=Streptomyces nigra TaxID=1827580 RepID=UPI0036543D21